jgi:UDP-glucuronate decarboxylase
MNSDCTEPVNLGSEHEATIKEWAELVMDVVEETLAEKEAELAVTECDGHSEERPALTTTAPIAARRKNQLVYTSRPSDDPQRRRADTTRARERLGWRPRWPVREGIKEVAQYFLLQGF